MTLRNVPKGYTLEQQRQEINLVAADLDTAVDGEQTFGGNKEFTGDLTFSSNDFNFTNNNVNINFGGYLYFFNSVGDGSLILADTSVWLLHSDETKLRTTSTGIDVLGNINFSTSGSRLEFTDSFTFADSDDNGYIVFTSSGVNLCYADYIKLQTTSTGISVSGDVVINIGTTNAKLYGSSQEFYIRNTDGTGSGGAVNIQGRSGVSLWTGTSQLAVAADSNGAGVLYYQSAKKLEATTGGVTVTGSVLIDNNLYVNSGYPGIGAQILETGAYRARVDDVESVVQDALVLGRFQNLDSFVVKANGDVSTIGDITASSFIGPITGNADTATALETARNIAGQSFDGTADITIAATDLSDTDQSLATTSDVTFNSITKSGGSSTEFLKADGTVDSNTYLTTETDPVFSASEAASITSTDTTNWDTAYGWGDHSTQGYLTVAAGGTAPTTAADPGTPGEIRYDADYIYICIATDTWKRAPIATW